MERQTLQAERPVNDAHLAAAVAAMEEPPTLRALWPTFMRRTLSEDLLRDAPERPGRA